MLLLAVEGLQQLVLGARAGGFLAVGRELVLIAKSGAEFGPEEADDDVEVGGGRDLRLVVLAEVHGLPFPEVRIERDMLGELALESINDPARGLAFATNIAGAADEEAEGFHGRDAFRFTPLRQKIPLLVPSRIRLHRMEDGGCRDSRAAVLVLEFRFLAGGHNGNHS